MAQINYPAAHKLDITDDYFGVKVADPYRWLELDNTPETQTWIKAENETTASYLSGIGFRDELRGKLEQIWNRPAYSAPSKENGNYYFFKNNGLQNQAILYQQKDLKSEPVVFLNPNDFSKDGTIALTNTAFSKGAKYCAYATSSAGSDWNTVYVLVTATKKILADKIAWLKFSEIAWKGDEGFYYSRYPVPKGDNDLTDMNRNHKIYFHKIGQLQSQDKLIYEDPEHPFRFHFARVTEDDRYLILYTSDGGSAMQIMIKNLYKSSKEPFKMFLEGFKYEAEIFDNDKKYFFVKTNASAPRYRVVSVSLDNPYINNWETLIPEEKEVLESIKPAGGSWFAAYLKDAGSTLSQFTMGGFKLKDIELPPYCSASIYAGHIDDKDFFYSWSSFIQPEQLYSFNIAKGKSVLFKSSDASYLKNDYETKQLFFYSEDGTQVPMFITAKKGIKQDGNNPVLMFGYGGFNVALKPEFKPENLCFINQGGMYVQVNIRGGSEYGEKWHLAGMGKNKQNVFNDFIGAAEYLIGEKYTVASKLAISGRSNGGLLVGACMVQRPDLFKVALPDVGVMDMLRYQKFTIGAAWEKEYGSSDERAGFDDIYEYTPLQNLKPNTAYPATFITTGDHDDRVVPAHSYKFAAQLQAYQKGPNPVLIRVDTDAGHGDGKPTSKMLDEQVDKMSFLMYNLGMKMK